MRTISIRGIRILWTSAAFLAVVAAGGCGGGSASQAVGGGSVSSSGPVATEFQGHPKPAVQSTVGSTSVVGIAGANYSSIKFSPNQDLSNTVIAFVLGENLWTYYNGLATQVTYGFSAVNHPGFSPYGLIVYSREDNDGFYQLWRCSYDGSGQTQITTDASDHNNPSYSPDGTKIVYDNYSNIYTIPSGGGSPTLVGPGDDPAYNWDGLHILAITNTTPSSLISYPLFLESNPPSGVENPNSANKLAAMTFLTSPKQIWIYDFMSGRFAQTYASSPTFGMSQPALSPDGKQMAFVGANGSAAPSIYLSNSEGLNAYPILFSASTTETVSQPAWSPYFQPRSFVGTSGLMFTTASGFLWSTVGSGFGSCVSFQAQTPSTASITPQGSATTSSLVFLIQADSITNLKYTNAYYGAVSTPISASTTTPEALISFNSTTGAVEITIPFLETRAGKTVRASASGKNLVYSGTIPAIYNAKGQNIAPAGAHQVTIDPKTGKLVSWS